MSDIEEKPRPGLRFLWLIIVTVLLAGVVTAGVIWSDATPTPKLALDLEGGTSIILEPQVSKDTDITTEQLDQAVAIIRQRIDSTGVSEAEISTQGDRNIVVNLPGNPDEETRNLVRSSAQLVFRRVALVGDPRSQEQMAKDQAKDGNSGQDSGSDLTDKEKERLKDLTGGGGQSAAPEGGGEVVNAGSGSVPGPAAKDGGKDGAESSSGDAAATDDSSKVTDSTPRPLFDPEADTAEWQTKDVIAKYSELDCTAQANRTGGTEQAADKPVVACAQDGSAKYILGPVELSGDHLDDAGFGYSTGANGVQTNQPAVNLSFDSTGREIFKQITSDITGKQQPYNQFAITLDGLVLSAPSSNAVITDGNAEITGSFTLDEAQTLANQLKNGSLPISFQVQSENQISPTLGSNYLSIGLLTGLVGLILVVIYSLLQYRVLGLVTVSSLVVAGIITYLLLLLVSWRYGYRLSLAGVAGIIIGIGMAADSFIVYFERVRDELRSGRFLLSAVEVGWERAKRTIYASKAVNMLAALILYILAVGSVRGFAFTLGLTVIVDVLIVFLFTHPMLEVLSRTKFFGEGHPMSGMDPRLLGVKRSAYRGALNIDLEDSEKTGEALRRERSRRRKSGIDSDTMSGAVEESSGGAVATLEKETTTSTVEKESTPAKTVGSRSKAVSPKGTKQKSGPATSPGGEGSIAERKAARRKAEEAAAKADTGATSGAEGDEK